MNTHTIALTLFLAISPTMSQASAPVVAKTLGSKLLYAGKGAALSAGIVFTAETFRCIYLANGNPQESSLRFTADVMAATYNIDKFGKKIYSTFKPESSQPQN